MKRPAYKRPNKGRIASADGVNYTVLARQVKYEGSPKHKVRKATAPLEGDPAKCPPKITPEQANTWLKQAVRKGAVNHTPGAVFPRSIWVKKNGTVYMGRITNADQGTYHGYPLWNELQWPDGIDELWPDA